MYKIIGIIYSILFVLCYIPQIIKIHKEKKTESVSILMYSMCFVAYILMGIYSTKFGTELVLLINSICGAALSIYTIILIQFYKNKSISN